MFLKSFYIFFCAEFKSNECQLEKPGHFFVNSRSKVNFKVKYDFSTNEAKNKCNPSFSCDFDREIYF